MQGSVRAYWRAVALLALAIPLTIPQQVAAQAVWTDPLVPGPTNGGLFPTFFEAYGQRHVYQLAAAPVGTVVLIHGCGRVANSFWPYDPVNCPQCEGLPEHVAQTKQALAMGYSVLALSPNDAGSRCWSSSTRDGRTDDRIGVADTVYSFQQNNSLLELPLFFYAFSSGGTMSLKLPTFLHQQAEGPAKQLRIDGIVSVDAAPSGGTGATDDDGKLVVPYHPPVLHVVMEKGKSRQRAPALIQALQDNGVPADLVVSYSRQVGPSFFSDRIPTMPLEQSEALVAALRQIGQLDEAGYLQFNPDRSPWADGVLGLLPWLGPQMLSIQQEMRVIWGEHENLGDFTTASLAWLEAGGKADLPTLLRELTVDRLAELTVGGGEAFFGVASVDAPAPAPAQA